MTTRVLLHGAAALTGVICCAYRIRDREHAAGLAWALMAVWQLWCAVAHAVGEP